ncbi:MAG: hypothetical protein IKS32_03075 [Solobacterium sp.]|nr:hypothetical protein [Solobacterium sp.]
MKSGVISPYGRAILINDTTSVISPVPGAFLSQLDVQKNARIADVLGSFRAVQSEGICLNIGFDTEFQQFAVPEKNRRVLSLQMSIAIGNTLIRYFFLVDPLYQEVTADGGAIPFSYCIGDILSDLRTCYFPSFPLVRKEKLVYKVKTLTDGRQIKVLDYKRMKDSIVPVTIICHVGKPDISVFRRSSFDTDLLRSISEIQGGWMSTRRIFMKVSGDDYRNTCWLINLNIRDTKGLTPAENKSLKALGAVIEKPKIELPEHAIEHMMSYALYDPESYYEYAMNDSDIVVLYCSELFLCNHAVPITLSSAAASSMRSSIMAYLGVKNLKVYDRKYRGLELLDEGLYPSRDESMKFLKATRYVPIRDNPDAKLVSEFFEEAFTGGFNTSFYIGWIKEPTTDFDLQNAYPTAMACIYDIDWDVPVKEFPKGCELTLKDVENPLVPIAVVGDFDFPDTCYCPNIPVPVPEGLKIYPLHGRNVYMSGPDIYLALKLGARIRVHRGFTCQILMRNCRPSQCLGYAVSELVRDRAKAKELFPFNTVIEKSLKTMVCSCYGKTAQNVSPKTRYNAKVMGCEDAEPSSVTSPYHASYTTALVRNILIASINQLHDMGYKVYSVTTDGMITNAPEFVLRNLDAYGFTKLFQEGRYALTQTLTDCKENHVWESKHYNKELLNITTRGNVAINDGGVLAHNSYVTGEEKGSMADREAFAVDYLLRGGKLSSPIISFPEFSEMVERKSDFGVREVQRYISMNFDYKRCPLCETAVDTDVHYEKMNGQVIDAVIANYDTRPYIDADEFMKYRTTVKNEPCIKVVADLKRVMIKAYTSFKGYIGKNLDRKILLSVLMGYRAGTYSIPSLDGLKQKEAVAVINSWGIAEITLSDWKNCSRSARQEKTLPYELLEDVLQKIHVLPIQEPPAER